MFESSFIIELRMIAFDIEFGRWFCRSSRSKERGGRLYGCDLAQFFRYDQSHDQ